MINDLIILRAADQTAAILLGGHLRAMVDSGCTDKFVLELCKEAYTNSIFRALLIVRIRSLMSNIEDNLKAEIIKALIETSKEVILRAEENDR